MSSALEIAGLPNRCRTTFRSRLTTVSGRIVGDFGAVAQTTPRSPAISSDAGVQRRTARTKWVRLLPVSFISSG